MFFFESTVASRGSIVFKNATWTNAYVGEHIEVEIEIDGQSKAVDPDACAINKKNQYFDVWDTVGHIPREISRHDYHFITDFITRLYLLVDWKYLYFQDPCVRTRIFSKWWNGLRYTFMIMNSQAEAGDDADEKEIIIRCIWIGYRGKSTDIWKFEWWRRRRTWKQRPREKRRWNQCGGGPCTLFGSLEPRFL